MDTIDELSLIHLTQTVADKVLSGLEKKIAEANGAEYVDAYVPALENLHMLVSTQKELIKGLTENNMMLRDGIEKITSKILNP